MTAAAHTGLDPGAPHADRDGNAVAVTRSGLRLTVAAAGLSLAGGITALLAPSAVYDGETTLLADAATAQDLVGVAVVAPLLLVLSWLAARGSLEAWLCCLGGLSFTVYNYAIYTLSIQFGPLFLVWVAVWGLSLFALVIGLAGMDPGTVKARFHGSPRLTGLFLIGMACLFGLLWLGEIVPDLVNGRGSTSAADWNVPTNPVHVLDLGFFLPAVAVTGVLLLRRHWFGYATAAAQLVFLTLTSLPILVTPFVASARGHSAGWVVLAPITLVALSALVVLRRFLWRSARG